MIAPVEPTPPPRDARSEESLLACLLYDPAYTLDKAKVSADEFYLPKHAALWNAAHDARREIGPTIDRSLLASYLIDKHLIEIVGGREYLVSLASVAHTPVNVPLYASRIREKATKREILIQAAEAASEAKNGAESQDIIRRMEAGLAYLKQYAQPSESQWNYIDGDALSMEPDDKLEMLWPGVLAVQHILLLSGTPKTGKSWLVYGMLGALSRGEPWLGNQSIPPVRAVIVSEEPRGRVKAKIRRFGVVGSVVLARGGAPPDATWPDVVAWAGKRAEEVGAKIVVFDTLSGLAGIEDENSAGQGNAAMRPVLRLAGERQVAVVVTHHAPNALRRSVGPRKVVRAIDFVRGTGTFSANPDAIAGLDNTENPDSDDRVFICEGRFDNPPVRLVITRVKGHDGAPDTYVTKGNPRELEAAAHTADEVAKVLRQQERVLDVLRDAAPTLLRRSAIKERCGGGTWVYSVLPTMVSAQKIRVVGEGTPGHPFEYGLP